MPFVVNHIQICGKSCATLCCHRHAERKYKLSFKHPALGASTSAYIQPGSKSYIRSCPAYTPNVIFTYRIKPILREENYKFSLKHIPNVKLQDQFSTKHNLKISDLNWIVFNRCSRIIWSWVEFEIFSFYSFIHHFFRIIKFFRITIWL